MNFLRQTNLRLASGISQVKFMSNKNSSSSGGAGAIRDDGGSFGKREAAFEAEYFMRKQKDQLKKLKEDLTDEITFHEEQIKRHQEAINRHKERVSSMNKDEQ